MDLVDKYGSLILKALEEKPLRYVDLDKACSNESTRVRKLRMLQDLGLITTTNDKIGKRAYIHYTLTEKGRKVVELLKGF